MTSKVKNALNRLNATLPLKQRQDDCAPEYKTLHQAILRSFVSKGRMLTSDEMSEYVENVSDAVKVLENLDMMVCSPEGEPTGSYPFTMENREHAVSVNSFTVHAMCALDALAVSPMFDIDTRINSICRVSNDEIVIMQSGSNILNYDAVKNVQFGISWGATCETSSCATSLCMEMIFLKNSEIAQQWLKEDPEGRECFTLLEAVEFSALFFVPLLSS